MGKSVSNITRLSYYGPTTYGMGHVTKLSEMVDAPKHYRPSLVSSMTFIEDLLTRLVQAGVQPGTLLRITIEET